MIIDGEWIVEHRRDTYPREIMIEVTTRCNYSCIHCFRNWMRESYTDMDINLFKRILDEASKLGVKKVSFSGWGEPLFHPDIVELLDYSKELGMEIILNTNGYLLDRYVMDIFRIGIDKIVVSIDSVSEDVYSRIRVGGSLPRVEATLKMIRDYKVEHILRKPEVHIQFTLNRLNIHDLKRIPEYAKRLGISKVIISNLIPLSTSQEDALSCYKWDGCKDHLDKYIDILVKAGLEYGITISMPNFNTAYSERSCPFISKYALYIRYDGKIAPCIYYAHRWRNVLMGVEREIDEVIFGDLNNESLLDIWRSRRYIEFRYNVFYMRQPSCLDCPLQRYCMLTLSNISDCWGNTPTCAHCPYSRDLTRCPL